MDPLPVEVYSAASVRAMDRHAIERGGIPGLALMERAGAAALESIRKHWPRAARITVLCGAGNNGGDGYVLARLARAAGLDVRVAALAAPSRLSGDAATAQARFAAEGGHAVASAADALAGAGLVVDALLGTGIDRPVAGAFLECIERVNGAGLPVLALDVPSGLDADTGHPHAAAIRATRTLAFIALKCGHFLGEAPDYVGHLALAGLDLPAGIREAETPMLRRLTPAIAADALPARRRGAHKGDHGRVLVVGGFAMAGAARLAGEAALRTGAGLVTVATRASSVGPVLEARPELIARAATGEREVARLASAADAVAVGPGLGTDDEASAAFEAAAGSERPVVVDADALTLLARAPRRRDDWILTPHPGEAARLLDCGVPEVQRDRLAAVRAIAGRYGGTCVLKGARTLVASAGALPWVCDRGNPGMATAGSGDVLTGVIAGLLAGGAAPPLAAAAGVLLHAEAGDRAARGGERGVIAGDLVAELRAVVNAPWS
jgi:ADP-dependent NAD(P)H-hydrate dehydratase / NAD(P)H-hydrate epimerase